MLGAISSLTLFLLRVLAVEQVALVEPRQSGWPSDTAIERYRFEIFSEVHSLLRQWGNALTPNGFSVALVSIPANTPLYHARKDRHDPSSPEWFSLDSELSYMIFGGRKNSSVYLRTYRTTASLGSVLYFNGLSGALINSTLDAQDLLVPPPPSNCTPAGALGAEFPRAKRLCAWGSKRGIDGFIRGHLGFEVMWCNTQDKRLRLVRNVEVTKWADEMNDRSGRAAPETDSECGPEPPHPDPSGNFNIFPRYAAWEWLRSASHLYNGLGESRLVLHSGWLVTARGREPGSKIAARLKDLSSSSIDAWKGELDRMLRSAMRQGPRNSEIDWRALTNLIVNRYGERLPELRMRLKLASRSPRLESTSQVIHAYRITSSLILPFYNDNAQPEQQATLCTFSMLPEAKGLNEHEHKIWAAIMAVHWSICDVILGIHSELTALRSSRSGEVSSTLATRVDRLMGQLHWPGWVRCTEVCAWGEVCYIPVWPLLWFGWPWGPAQERPEPRCVGSLTDSWLSGNADRMGIATAN